MCQRFSFAYFTRQVHGCKALGCPQGGDVLCVSESCAVPMASTFRLLR